MDLKRINKIFLSTDNVEIMVAYIKQALDNYYTLNKSSIENYDKWIENSEKEDYLKKPEYKIYELKNRNSQSSIVANVKWKFLYEGKYLKNKATILYLSSKKKYTEVDNNKILIKDINKLIRNHFNEKSPFFTIDEENLKSMNQEVKLYYYWKNKLVELEYRNNPIFYLSQSKNNKPEQVIINIKWGFEVQGKEIKPRYILKRFTLDKQFVGNLEEESLQFDLKGFVKTHIKDKFPVIFNPPQIK
jgi:hypothetical protein